MELSAEAAATPTALPDSPTASLARASPLTTKANPSAPPPEAADTDATKDAFQRAASGTRKGAHRALASLLCARVITAYDGVVCLANPDDPVADHAVKSLQLSGAYGSA